MDENLLNELKKGFKGDVATDPETLTTYSHDASLFEVKPQVVVFPKNAEDVEYLVKFVNKNKDKYKNLSLTGRSAGTDMGGGSINDSIIVEFSKYFAATPVLNGDVATTQPGVFYRDFEKETLKHNLLFPSYPASREICAMGGIVNNNSGGEKSLKYGKTEKYVKRVKVVLSDGSVAEFRKLNEGELKEKMGQENLEGKIYKGIYDIVDKNYDALLKAKPTVSKNSAGYFLWNVYDKEEKTFDLTKLWVGAQGTLGMLLEADISLVPTLKHHDMVVIYLHDLTHLKEIVDEVLPLDPESFEGYDDNTLKLALKFFPEFMKQLGPWGMIQAGLAFFPAFIDLFLGHMPKLVLQVDFAGNDPAELKKKTETLYQKLKHLHPQVQFAMDEQEKKYWLVRRESFNLLRKRVRGLHTAPFVDDFIVHPKDTAEVLGQVISIFKKYPEFIYTITGHIGDGNFHIIPLVDIKNPKVKEDIPVISKEVYKIVLDHGGSITGEHNDGLVRSSYLTQMYGEDIVKLFEKTKQIFDPKDIFNPRKKVGSSFDYAMNHIRTNWDK